MMLLVKSAQGLLEASDDDKAFRLFNDPAGKYVAVI